jgi:hypothetical protein
MLKLTICTDCKTEKGLGLIRGTVVEYLGHIPGGMVLIKINGVEDIIHPLVTKELA